MEIKHVSIFGNPDKSEIEATVSVILDKLDNCSVEYSIQSELASKVGRLNASIKENEIIDQADIVISLGGDGTMLRAARALLGSSIPLMGVNLGSLGFLTDVPLNELSENMDALIAGHYSVVNRKRISGKIHNSQNISDTYEALNDIVLNMGPLARPVLLEIIIDGVSLGEFLGDGLIMSTPTGSTAYNLSAGGPIAHPAVSAILITPICPHSIAMRPLLAPEREVRVIVHDSGAGARLTADGQVTCQLDTGDTVSCRVSENDVRLIKFEKGDYFRAMRRKLQWGAINRRADRK